MLISGKKIRAMRDKINKYSNSCVVRKNISERNKNHNPPLQVKWSVPYMLYMTCFLLFHLLIVYHTP